MMSRGQWKAVQKLMAIARGDSFMKRMPAPQACPKCGSSNEVMHGMPEADAIVYVCCIQCGQPCRLEGETLVFVTPEEIAGLPEEAREELLALQRTLEKAAIGERMKEWSKSAQ